MSNQNLQLLEFLLSQSESVPISRLEKEMNVSKRQIHRYLADLKKINPDLETTRAGSKGVEETSYRINIDHVIDSPGLTPNQFNQLMDMIDNYGEIDSKLRGKLLYILSKARFAAFFLSENEKKIKECINKKVKLKIRTYYHRDKQAGPLVLKPVRLDSFNGRVYAYQEGEEISKVNKYNLELMDIDDQDFTGESFDLFKETGIKNFNPFKIDQDPFGFYLRENKYRIVLLLKPFAYSQLFRQFPHLMAYVNRLENPSSDYLYKLEMTVYDIQPIARFVTGLLNEILIIKNQETSESYFAIQKYIEKRVFQGLELNYNQCNQIGIPHAAIEQIKQTGTHFINILKKEWNIEINDLPDIIFSEKIPEFPKEYLNDEEIKKYNIALSNHHNDNLFPNTIELLGCYNNDLFPNTIELLGCYNTETQQIILYTKKIKECANLYKVEYPECENNNVLQNLTDIVLYHELIHWMMHSVKDNVNEEIPALPYSTYNQIAYNESFAQFFTDKYVVNSINKDKRELFEWLLEKQPVVYKLYKNIENEIFRDEKFSLELIIHLRKTKATNFEQLFFYFPKPLFKNNEIYKYQLYSSVPTTSEKMSLNELFTFNQAASNKMYYFKEYSCKNKSDDKKIDLIRLIYINQLHVIGICEEGSFNVIKQEKKIINLFTSSYPTFKFFSIARACLGQEEYEDFSKYWDLLNGELSADMGDLFF